ncbi:hypothetical protein [Duganella sp. Root336D2]|uniref:head-tail joining protein n=1 Tax=Duganella sp. Root336D2 TaxID=1736518 RepID=UPI0006F3490B|nr:hypothetical protein [Duganella sp. Root336D2]KQV51354.1 hypothetical protein ASD07_10695 [Duganella sp. Root336D2]
MIQEDLDAFLVDHGVEFKVGAVPFMGILDKVDSELDIGKVRTTSTMYTLLVKSSVVADYKLRNGSEITIGANRYAVREPEQIDDGAFTQLNLTKK